MVAVILFGFFQWEARGMADVRNVPLCVHSATLSLGAGVVAMHCAMALLAAFPPFVALAEAVAGSA